MAKDENLRISNIVCTGKIPESIMPLNFSKIVKNSKHYCIVNNEDCCPILAFFFPKGNGKRACVSIWRSGSINIVGVLSLNEAKKYYKLVVAEILRVQKLS